MAKVKWGSGAASAEDIDNVDRSKNFTPYEGPTPPAGVYRFWLKRLKKAESKAGNPKLTLHLELVPRKDIPEQKPYKGFFLVDDVPVGVAFRVAAFCDAIGVTGKEFVQQTVVDEDGNIKKIGKWTNDGKVVLVVAIRNGQDQNGNTRMEVSSYIPLVTEDSEDDDNDDDAGTDGDDDAPF